MTAEHHPSDVMLSAFAAGALDEAQRLAVASHVNGCARCRAFVDADRGAPCRSVRMSGSPNKLKRFRASRRQEIGRE
jgi:anti-sigma factor ChrR (cupin superfamily)